ncbi:retrotransposon like protein [Arabidopsis thaliana]|jgi:histone deacetylase 1/2|uniref:Retrotransposon like protein n=1 Tax=Arabidopsis thaliana TaxID=3702 RepID=O23529_ARATH|nr:retrotransposon like protein [Arabidopsis thaliana]CAB80958.1 retrotransposon like protein [Arabidopsis thaliana]
MGSSANGLPATTDEAIVFTPQTIFNINTSNVTKLTSNNYLMWSLQIHALLDGYELAGHLDGSIETPAPTLTTNNVVSANPQYTLWKRQDRLIFSALIGAISPPVQPLVSRATKASQIWKTLTNTYAKSSYDHIKQLRTQIKQLKKGTKTIDEYVLSHTTLLDQLAILGKPMEHEEQVERILEGLPEDYKTVVDQIEGKDNTPSITEIHERLINHEAKLLSTAALSSSSLPMSANVAQQRHHNNNRNNNQNKNRTQGNTYTNNWQPSANNKSGQRPFKPYLGKCQICNVQGHSARRCPQLQAMQPSSSSSASTFTPWQPRANLAMGAPYTANNWLLDSGATHHITSDLNALALHQPYNGDDVMIADGTSLKITKTGSTFLPSNARDLTLNKVLYVPDIQKNLVSVYRLCNTNQVSVEFFPASFQVKDLNTGTLLLQGRTKDELYEWPVTNPKATALFTTPSPKTTLSSWHSRLGHPSSSILNTLISKFSLPVSVSASNKLACSDCFINKSHKLPFSISSIKSTSPLEYIFSDVWMSPILSPDNYKYYLVLVDHHTRYTWLYPLQQKSQVKSTFIAFKALVENRFQAKIRTLYSDNGGEFIALREFLVSNGISHLTSPPHTPEHNGLSERKHRHIVETGLTLLTQASVPREYWPYAFAAAVYLINRMPTPVLSMESPFQKLFGSKPNYERLRVFGCLCFPWLRPYTHNKLEERSRRCVFLGYSLTQTAYLCFDVEHKRLYTSRHVVFDEASFPFSNLTSQNSLPTVTFEQSSSPLVTPILSSSSVLPSCLSSPCTVLHQQQPPVTTPNSPHSSQPTTSPAPLSPHRSTTMDFQVPQVRSSSPLLSSSSSLNSEPTAPNENGPEPEAQSPPIGPLSNPTHEAFIGPLPNPNRNPTNEIEPTPAPHPKPVKPTTTTTTPNRTTVSDASHQPTAPQQNQHNMKTRAKNNIKKPNTKFSLTATLPNRSPSEPTNVTQALKDKKWRFAMSDEFDAQQRNHTWDLVPHESQLLVGCKWVFKLKYLPNGAIDKYKARLVAKGFNQQYGVDYAETFSPVIKSTTIRLVLDVAVKKDWEIKQLDVNNAFLQGTLTEEVYMAQPPGFIDKDRPTHVCRLRKAIYGLKQAPRAWYMELKQHLFNIGFVNSLSDASLFIYCHGTTFVYVLVYVDDIIVTGSDKSSIDAVLTSLAERFSIKDPTDLHYFLGIEATRTKQGLHLMQRKYIKDLLAKHNMADAKPVLTPLPTSPKLTLHGGTKLNDASEYRSVVGSLQYLAFTRPDIAYAVNRLSQLMPQPTEDHWQAAKRVLRYLAGTSTHGIFLDTTSPLNLHAFSDADWAGDSDDYVSTNAYVIYLGKNPISWSSKKQRGVARSSTESEYRAVANAASEVKWLCSLLSKLHIRLPIRPSIFCDNIGATYLCANPVFHSRMKHIAIDYHFVRNMIQSGALRVSHVSTRDQLADALTKPLSRAHFQSARFKIGVRQLPPS